MANSCPVTVMPPEPETWRYGDHRQQRVLLLRPDRPAAALLAFVHGGGWVGGAPEDGLAIVRSVADAGFAAASIGYRLAPAARHPDQAADVAAGFRAVIERLDLPPRQAVLSGHSAGAQLVFWLAFEQTVAARSGWDPRALAGLVGISGVFDLCRAGRVAVMARDWIRPAFGDESGWAAASPLSRVTGGLPPVLLLNAEKDWGLHRQGELMCQALTAAGVACARQVIRDRNHLSVVQRFGEDGDPAVGLVTAFLRRLTTS